MTVSVSLHTAAVSKQENPDWLQLPSEYEIYAVQLQDEQILDLQPLEFLNMCWSNAFDTACATCNVTFRSTKEIPVRALGLCYRQARLPLKEKMKTSTEPIMTINNFHLHCLTNSSTRLYPVSHAWHAAVADAYASREASVAAARLAYEVPLRSLIAAHSRFVDGNDGDERDSKLLIWHDYVSIPQWDDAFRGTQILPQIFDMFSAGVATIVNLDIAPEPLLHAADRPWTDGDRSRLVDKVFGSYWFSRLWPVVEYQKSRIAYIMDVEYTISQLSIPELVAKVTSTAQAGTASVVTASKVSSFEYSSMVNRIPFFIRPRSGKLCLGTVYDMIGGQGCRSYRDRFIAACALLDIPDYAFSLPSDPEQAHLWLLKACLLNNDYSPLLLKALANEPLPPRRRIQWLRSRSAISANTWGWGVEISQATQSPRLDADDAVMLSVHEMGILHAPIGTEMPSAHCQHCGAKTTLLADIWQQTNGNAYVYSIPGLRYANSPSRDVAIIVESGIVKGRSQLPSEHCTCSLLVEIRLLWRSPRKSML